MRTVKKLILLFLLIVILAISEAKNIKFNTVKGDDTNRKIQVTDKMPVISKLSEAIDVKKPKEETVEAIGTKLDEYKGVAVFNNGEAYTESYGRHYSSDGYYYGYKWQCVEFVKRFYYDVKQHKMPDVYGHAKDFFDIKVNHGSLNKSRNLIQFTNGKDTKPEIDDILIFNDTKYGHIAIITEVSDSYIEVIQQNVYRKTREKFNMTVEKGKYMIGTTRKPAGWLRKDE